MSGAVGRPPVTVPVASGQGLQLLGTFGDQTPDGPSLTREAPVDLPAYDDCELHDGLLDEEGEIWDSTGKLVAQSRQPALYPRPPA